MSATSTGSRGLSLTQLRPGGRGFRTLFLLEGRMFLREPVGWFWGMVFPVVLLVIVGSTSANGPRAAYGGLRFIDIYTPVLLVFVFAIVSLQAMPATLIAYREKGYLRRLSTTPVGAGRLLQAQWAIYTLMCVAAAIVTSLVAKVAFNVHFPSQFLGFVVILLLTAAATLSLGTLIASIARVPRAGQLMGTFSFFVLEALAGLWVPQQEFGTTLSTISHCTPLAASVDGIQATMAGHWPPGWCFLALVVWAVIAGRLAIRLFRWE